jgi:hypothetical protein
VLDRRLRTAPHSPPSPLPSPCFTCQILGVESGVSDSGIKSAYRKMSLKYHPDKNVGDEAAAQMFIEVGMHTLALCAGAHILAVGHRTQTHVLAICHQLRAAPRASCCGFASHGGGGGLPWLCVSAPTMAAASMLWGVGYLEASSLADPPLRSSPVIPLHRSPGNRPCCLAIPPSRLRPPSPVFHAVTLSLGTPCAGGPCVQDPHGPRGQGEL